VFTSTGYSFEKKGEITQNKLHYPVVKLDFPRSINIIMSINITNIVIIINIIIIINKNNISFENIIMVQGACQKSDNKCFENIFAINGKKKWKAF
jgi:hypothetical protein